MRSHPPGRYRTSPRLTALGRVVSLLLILLAAASSAGAQIDPGELEPGASLYEIRLVDGSILIGTITEVDGDAVVVITPGGARVEVDRGQMRQVRLAAGSVVDGEFWHEDANSSRLFFFSTARPLRRGEAYLGTHLIVLPFVNVGLTDRLTLGGGAPILLGELEPVYVMPKVQLFGTEKAGLAVGTLHFFRTNDEDVGVAYGVGTFGTEDNALTVGLGFGYSGTDFASEPVALIGAELRMSRRAKFITENYYLPDDTGFVFSGGIRFIGERFSADLGVAGASEDGDVGCCLPLVSVAYAFGGSG